MRKMALIKISFFLFLATAFALQLSAQPVRGLARLSGKVVDEAGNPVPNAKVTVKGLENEKFEESTITDKDGSWKIAGLGSGYVKVEIMASGFLPGSKQVNVSQIDRNPSVKIVLKRSEVPIAQDEDSMKLFEEGSGFFDEGKYDDALASFQRFLGQNPLAYQIHFNMGNCYKEKGEFDKAQAEYQKVIDKAREETSPDSKKLEAKALAAVGELFLKNNDLASAQDYFKQSLALSPQDEILAYNVGEICFSNAKMDESIEFFKLAAQIKPDWPDAYLKLGYVYLNKTDYAHAKENFKKFLELGPDHPQAQSVKGILDYLEKM